MVRKFVCVLLVMVLAFGMVFLSADTTSAINSERLGKWSNYQIYFYDPDHKILCIPGTTEPGVGTETTPFSGGAEQWNGSCSGMTASRIEWIKKYLPSLQKKASENGIPWELIPGQVFQESGGGKQEACDYNPLGLKAKKGHASCSNGFAKFGSYDEAFQYYMDSITPIKELKNKYPNDPYSAVSFIEYGASSAYASCDSESYSQCVGHMGEPTPGYVQSVSSIMCGIQKWAKGDGIAISSVTWENYSPTGEYATTTETTGTTSGTVTAGTGASYCDENGEYSGGGDYESPEAGNLADFIKKWAWSDYTKGKTDRTSAYADYMDNVATYKGAMNGVDCGAFVANIMVASGWDPNYVQGGTSAQKNYLQQNWTQVSTDSLQIGDVGIRDGHVILYAGNIDGFNSNTVSASQNDRAPMAGADKNLNNYTWYRK